MPISLLNNKSHGYIGRFSNWRIVYAISSNGRRGPVERRNTLDSYQNAVLVLQRTLLLDGAAHTWRRSFISANFSAVAPPLLISKLKRWSLGSCYVPSQPAPTSLSATLWWVLGRFASCSTLSTEPRSASRKDTVYDLTHFTHLTPLFTCFRANDSAHPNARARIGFAAMLCVRHLSHYTIRPIPAYPQPTPLPSKQPFISLAAHFLEHRLRQLHYRPPSSRELPPADKSYIWLALCDLSALGVFVWEVFAQWSSSSSSAHGSTPGISATSRLWLALTLRQTCFLIVSALILTHVRLRKSVSFGTAHCLLWVPLVFLATVSTIVAGAFAATTTYPGRIFRVGFITYSSAIALLNTIMFGCLVGTLIIIRRSLENFQKAQGFQPSNESADRSQDADIDVIREGSSWITSTTSSRQRQDAANLSPFSTRTRHTSQSAAASPEWGAMPLRFPFWPPPGPHPYSSLPQTSPRRDDAHYKDFEPFRRRAQSLRAAALTLSSGNSWITSSLGTHPTLSAWSYPTVPTLSSHQATGSAIASPPTRNRSTASVRFPTVAAPIQAEKGQASPLSDSPASPVLEISVVRIIAWLAGVWVPLVCSPSDSHP